MGIGSLAAPIVAGLATGVNLKLVQQRFTCRGQCDPGVTATTVVIDAGVQWSDLFDLPLRLGAAVAHAGPRIQFFNEEQADPLPTRLRFAAGWRFGRRALFLVGFNRDLDDSDGRGFDGAFGRFALYW